MAGVALLLAFVSFTRARFWISPPLEFLLSVVHGMELVFGLELIVAGGLLVAGAMLWKQEEGALAASRWAARALLLLFPFGTIAAAALLFALRQGRPVAEAFVRENPLPPPPTPSRGEAP